MKKARIYFPFILIALLFSCKKEIKKSALFFKEVNSKDSGVDFSNDLTDTNDLNIIDYLYYYNGGGVAIGDINNDGLDDIYFTANQLPDRLYLNLGNLKFKDITQTSGIVMDNSWSTGVTMADVNNDGFLDIYVSKLGNLKIYNTHNQLYINNGDNTFTESSKTYGLDFSGFSTQATFFDYDRDGDLDMYLMNHSVHAIKNYGKAERRNDSDSLSGDVLFENKMNEADHKFVDVTKKAGIFNSSLGFGLGLIASDINQDGLIDIYVGNDFHENDYLYINQGDKTFKESAEQYFSHTSQSTMGVDVADMNNDHLFDVFTLDMMPDDYKILLKSGGEDMNRVSQIKKNFGFGSQYAHNSFQLNRDTKSFSEISLLTQSFATDWSWSVLLQDFDNDGLNDIFITNGIYKRPNDLDYINFLNHLDIPINPTKKESADLKKKLIDKMPSHKISNIIFKNKGNLEFEKTSLSSGFEKSFSNGAAYSDLDNDGDLDLVVNNINQKASILENKSESNLTNNYVSLAFEGSQKYNVKIGTKAIVYCKDTHFVKELTTTKGFESASNTNLHFGLGLINKIDSAKVIWPDGFAQTVKTVNINKLNKIKRLDSETHKLNAILVNNKRHYQIFPFHHQENTFYDYEKEVLIPENLSTEGPAVVQADFNNDGLNDIFLGGARYQASRIFFKQKDGSYQSPVIDVFKKDNRYEDVAATNIDIDNDGDEDLYVVSGGNDKLERDPSLMDRIYINDGNGNFERLKLPLFMTNGGTVSTCDFDNDGYTDLFVGNRSIPSGYGLSPYSFILRNNQKKGFEIVQKFRLGMVTTSKWADINNDKLPDLVVAGDWMPITVLINNGDKTFKDQTKEYGLDKTNGMWNTIEIKDIDQNGTLDIVGGNAGLNFKWKATESNPVKLYLDDFDSNGQLDPIIFYNYFGHFIPFATKDMLVRQIPSLGKKFDSNEDFSKVSTIKELTGKSENQILETKEIYELRSMIYYNREGIFKGNPLPKEAQLSSIQYMYIDTIGGKTTMMFIGNNYNNVTEIGDNNASSGGVFLSFENNNFDSFKYLPIPAHINGRKLVALGKNLFLAVSNNGNSYLLYKPRKDN
jgi:enediyne biosynthesis protein E4